MKTKYLLFIICLLTVVILPIGFCQDNTQAGLPKGAIARLGKGGINIMRFSPDGTRLAVGTDVGVWLYDVPSEKETALFTGHTGQVNALAFSPDGKLLASASLDKTVQVWNIDKRSKLATFKGHKVAVSAVAFSPDAKTVASGDVKKKIKLWDVSSQRERATLTGHTSGICALVFSPDGDTLVSGSDDGTIRFWNPVTGKEITTFTSGHKKSVKSIAFTENDTNLAIAAFDGTIDVWSLKNHRYLKTFADGKSDLTQAIALSSDAKLLACQGYNGKLVSIPYQFRNWEKSSGHKPIQLWELNKGFELPVLTEKGIYGALAFSPDNKILSGSISRGIRGWDVITGNELFHFDTKNYTAKRLVFSPDGKKLAAQSIYGTTVWDLNSGDPDPILDSQCNAGLSFSPNSGTIAFGDHHGLYLRKLDAAQAIVGRKLPDKYKVGEYYSEFTFSPDGTALVAAGREFWDVQIKIRDIETGSELTTLAGHTQRITTLAFSHDGKVLASGSSDGTVLLWDWEKISTKP